MYLNKAIICGNLTNNPDRKTTDSGTVLATMTVATNRTYTDSGGAKQEDTEFHDVVVFGSQAENCADYLSKGQQVLVEGRLQTRNWEDESGDINYRTELIGQRVQFGSGGDSVESDETNTEKTEDELPDDEGITPEDIPF